MKREKALVKNTVILSLGTYLPKLTTVVTLPLLTGYLTKADYGAYDLINTLVSLLLPAVTLQIQSAAFRFLISCRDSDAEISKIVTNIFAFTIPVSLITLVPTYFTLVDLGPATRALILTYFFTNILYIGIGQVARGLGRNFFYATSAVLVSGIMMLGTCVALLMTKSGLDGILLGMVASCVAGTAVLSVQLRVHRYLKWSLISVREIKRMLSYSWPMVPNALSSWVLSLSDRLVITSFIGIEANAVYAVANKIPNLIKTFQGTFTSAWQENASISVTDDDKDAYYSRMLDAVFCLLVGLTAVLIASTPVLFKLLIRGAYDDAYQQMSILYMGAFFSCLSGFLGGIYIAHMKTKSVGLTTLSAAAINLAIDLALIKSIGIYAGSISTLISYVLLFLFRLLDIQKFQKVEVKMYKSAVCVLALIAMCVLCARRTLWLDVANGIIGIALAVTVNHSLLRSMLVRLLRKARPAAPARTGTGENGGGSMARTVSVDCTGCHACEQSCPAQCIRFEEDAEGFPYPTVDEARCTHCGLCERVCHTADKPSPAPLPKKISAYYGWSKDPATQAQSSSGGAFSAIADAWLGEEGVVFGAAFSEDFQSVRHEMAQAGRYERLRKSKYVFSDLGDSYQQAEQALRQGKRVVFTGTPCQVAGLRAFLEKEYENLLTVDFICHGTPSAKLYRAHLNYVSRGKAVKKVDFRSKAMGWRTHCLKVETGGGTYLEGINSDYYLHSFMHCTNLRKCCYNCRYSAGNHVSDITVADFWGIKKYKPDYTEDKGVSLILFNRERAAQVLDGMRERMALWPLEAEHYAYVFKEHDHYGLAQREAEMRRIQRLGYDAVAKQYYRGRHIRTFRRLAGKILGR